MNAKQYTHVKRWKCLLPRKYNSSATLQLNSSSVTLLNKPICWIILPRILIKPFATKLCFPVALLLFPCVLYTSMPVKRSLKAVLVLKMKICNQTAFSYRALQVPLLICCFSIWQVKTVLSWIHLVSAVSLNVSNRLAAPRAQNIHPVWSSSMWLLSWPKMFETSTKGFSPLA